MGVAQAKLQRQASPTGQRRPGVQDRRKKTLPGARSLFFFLEESEGRVVSTQWPWPGPQARHATPCQASHLRVQADV